MFTEEKVALHIWRVFSPVWFVLGSVGNLLTIIVLIPRRNRNSSISKYLIALAVSDILILWTRLTMNWLQNGYGFDIRSTSSFMCKINMFLIHFGTHCSALFILILTIERFIATWLPMKAKHICTSKRANIVILSLFAFIALINIHFLFGMEIQKRTFCYPKDERYANFFFNTWSLIQLTLFSLIPFAVTVFANFAIILRIVMMRRKTQTQVIPQISAAARARRLKDRQVTVMLIALNIVYLVCGIPLFVFVIYHYGWILSQGNTHTDAVLKMTFAIINALYYSNNSVNFIIYFLSVSAFRKETKRILCKQPNSCLTIFQRNIHSNERNLNISTPQENPELQNIG